jgi:selenide,water dikinase
MARGSGVCLAFDAEHLPLLPGARALAAAGHLTGGCRRNRAWLEGKVALASHLPHDLVEVAWDPQTSGGLLVAVPAAAAGRVTEALGAAGVDAVVVGEAGPRADGPWVVLR